MIDSLARSLVKTLVWRIIGAGITMVVVYLFTGSFTQASTITVTAAAVLAVGYYVHERAWDRIDWGRRKLSYSKTYSK